MENATTKDAHNRRTIGLKGLKWNAIGSWGGQLISFVIFTLLANILSPSDFGLVASASIYISLINLFVTQGFGMAIIQRKDLTKGHLDSAFWASILSSIVFGVVTFASSDALSSFLGNKDLRPFIAVLSLDFVFIALSVVQSAILQKELKFFELTLRQIISQTIGGAIGIAMAFAGFGAWSLVCQTLASSLVAFIITWRACDYRPGRQATWQSLVDLWKYSWAVIASNLMNFFASRIDQYTIGKTIGSISLGYYSIAQKIIGLLINGLVGPITAVAVPLLAKAQNEKDRIPAIIYHGLEMGSFFCYPVFCGLACLAYDTVLLLFGAKWTSAADLLLIFALGETVNLLALFDYAVFMALGKPNYVLWLLIAKAIGTAMSAVIGIGYGMHGVALGMAVNGAINTALSIALLGRVVSVSLAKMLGSVLPAGLGSAIMSIGVIFLHRTLPADFSTAVRLAICIGLGAALYAGAMRLVSKRLFTEAMKSCAIMLSMKTRQKE